MNIKLIIAFIILIGLLYGAYSLGERQVVVTYQTNPLVSATCPEPTPLYGDDFGSTTLKLISVGGQYVKCRAACLAN